MEKILELLGGEESELGSVLQPTLARFKKWAELRAVAPLAEGCNRLLPVTADGATASWAVLPPIDGDHYFEGCVG